MMQGNLLCIRAVLIAKGNPPSKHGKAKLHETDHRSLVLGMSVQCRGETPEM